jgi:hypothetical protein
MMPPGNTKPIGVAYSDPDFTEIYLNGSPLVVGSLSGIASVEVIEIHGGACQFRLRDSNGEPFDHVVSGIVYKSESDGTISSPCGGITTGNNGTVLELVPGLIATFSSSAEGLIDLKVDRGVSLPGPVTYYFSFVLTDGTVFTTPPVVITGH